MANPSQIAYRSAVVLGTCLLIAITFYTKEFFSLLPINKFQMSYPIVYKVDYIIVGMLIALAGGLIVHGYRLAKFINSDTNSTDQNWIQTTLWYAGSGLLLTCAPLFASHHQFAETDNAKDIVQFISSPTGIFTSLTILVVTVMVLAIPARRYHRSDSLRFARIWLVWRPLTLLAAAIVSNAPQLLTTLVFVVTGLSFITFATKKRLVGKMKPFSWTRDCYLEPKLALIFVLGMLIAAMAAGGTSAPSAWLAGVTFGTFFLLGMIRAISAQQG